MESFNPSKQQPTTCETYNLLVCMQPIFHARGIMRNIRDDFDSGPVPARSHENDWFLIFLSFLWKGLAKSIVHNPNCAKYPSLSFCLFFWQTFPICSDKWIQNIQRYVRDGTISFCNVTFAQTLHGYLHSWSQEVQREEDSCPYSSLPRENN